MNSHHRNYRLTGQGVAPVILSTLHDIEGWPQDTRYVICSIDATGTFRAYIEFSRPTRPAVFGHLTNVVIAPRSSASRDEHRAAVQDVEHVDVWHIGSWEAGLPGRPRGSGTTAVLRRQLAEMRQEHARLQAELIASQGELLASKDELLASQRLAMQLMQSATTSAGTSAAVVNNTTNHTDSHDTNTNSHNTNNTIIINNLGQENLSYLDAETLRQRLLAKTRGVVDTIRDVHLNDQHPENHNIYLLSSRRNEFEVLKDGQWTPLPSSTVIDDLLFKGYRINWRGAGSVDRDAMEPVVLEAFDQWVQDMLAMRLGTCSKLHITRARQQVRAMIQARRRRGNAVAPTDAATSEVNTASRSGP